LAEAPGPVVRTREELLDAIADVERSRERYRPQANRWRERFTPLDDGHAGERVVRRMIDAGWL